MKALVVLDGTMGVIDAQARTLDAFLRRRLTGVSSAETVILHDASGDRRALVRMAPTRDVRLVASTPWRPDLTAGSLAGLAEAHDVSLVLLGPGSSGVDLATRVACRTGGTVVTEVLGADVSPGRLRCSRALYSNHLLGLFESRADPWCLSVDAGLDDGGDAALTEHRILSESPRSPMADTACFRDVEVEERPAYDDIGDSRSLVVAGYGVGGREGAARAAAAAARMGAAFGVTRPVVMNAWASAERLIGVSGRRVAPALCIVVGASGAPALHWGIEKAAVIVALNLDERAPIVADADLAVIGNGLPVLEELAAIVAARRRE